ncbi:MAG TPA: trehalose-6-phosphate synthase, partial [Polyangia bacterium]
MKRVARFLVVLLASGALLAWVAATVVERTTRRWFEDDIVLRAGLVENGARQNLLAHWSQSPDAGLGRIVADIARDERIMAAAACTDKMEMLARSPLMPPQISCAAIGKRMAESRAKAALSTEPRPVWGAVWGLPGGDVHVSAVPLVQDEQQRGFLVLVLDLSVIERREA